MIYYKDMKFDKVEQFDCHVLSFEYKEGGRYWTVLPISPLEYRKDYPTGACVEVEYGKRSTKFFITDDCRRTHIVILTNKHKEAIEFAVNEAREQGLLKENE